MVRAVVRVDRVCEDVVDRVAAARAVQGGGGEGGTVSAGAVDRAAAVRARAAGWAAAARVAAV